MNRLILLCTLLNISGISGISGFCFWENRTSGNVASHWAILGLSWENLVTTWIPGHVLEMPKSLSTKNVVFIGDAAHGMLPYLAQGANKALEDSWCLSKLLQNKSLNLKTQLNRYSTRRLDRLKKLDKASVNNEKIYHLENYFFRQITKLFLQFIVKYIPGFIFWRLDWIYKFKE